RRPRARALVDHLKVFGRELVHHYTAVFPVGNLSNQWRYLSAAELQPRQTFCLVVGLHLADQLGITALCLDHTGDGARAPWEAGAAGGCREWGVPETLPARLLDRVLLEQDPLVA